MQLSALDIHYLIKEWEILLNSKLDKVFSEEDLFLFQFHAPSLGKKYLKVILPGLIFITENKEKFDQPDNFCIKLRRTLTGSRLRKIEQIGFERIIDFIFEAKEGTFHLFIELFSKGNMILCDENLKILIGKKYQKWSERTIRGGIEYTYPQKDFNYFKLTPAQFNKFLETTDKNSIVVSLAKDLGLGGTYAEEACKIAGIDKKKSKLDEKDRKVLYTALEGLKDKKIRPVIYEKKGIVPFVLSHIEEDYIESDNYNALIDKEISQVLSKMYTQKRDQKYNEKVAKLNGIFRQQQAKIKGFEKAIEENQKKGDEIYQNYDKIGKILTQLKKELKEKGKDKLIKEYKNIKSIDTKNKEVTFEL